MLFSRIILILFACLGSTNLLADWQWQIGAEYRYFLEDGRFEEQLDMQPSAFIQPEYSWVGSQRDRRFSFIGFYRFDDQDNNRSRGDIREALYSQWFDIWEYRIGLGKVYWGVTESLQLVDIINQTDINDSIDGDAKYGQPMIHNIWLTDIGKFEAFVLPGFREQTFPDEQGRFRGPLPVSDNARYQASDEEKAIDGAFRWSHSIEVAENPLDITVGFFRGTSRSPEFEPEVTLINDAPVVTAVVPYYPVINQYSSTLLYAYEGLLLKAEGIYRQYFDDSLEDYRASVSGFEYTFVGPFDWSSDVGWLMEFQYDERGSEQSEAHKDLFIGSRVAFNDAASSELLFGVTQDLDQSSSRVLFVEASRRLSEQLTLDLNVLTVNSSGENDPLDAIDQDDLIELALNFYF